MRIPQEGDKFRVKADTLTRKHALQGYNRDDVEGCLYPIASGEVGEVLIYHGDHWDEMHLEFYGRCTVLIGTLYHDKGEWEFAYYRLEQLEPCD